uniref:Glycosyltransferase involved in cell wall bisynthesis n=1 Tax=Candidatus Kentrum sp. DK TaxID=2126562 RepID=A0A450SXB8_9GAMM|nr:MAG: Glycosyltransferase involved in cell wall bisynthesis [Candidatus Kentron sp. DK]
MRIAVISKSDVRGGGASVVAANLAKQYNLLGHSADHINLTETGRLHPYGGAARVISALKQWDGRRGYRDHRGWEIRTLQARRLVSDYDAIHLHDMSTVYSHEMIAWLAKRAKVIWTIHDCSPFTAGCLYPGACTKFHSACAACPQTYSWPIQSSKDRTSELHKRRRAAIESSPIHFTAPSRWMIGEFLKGGYGEDRISFVPNGVDKSIFHPRDREKLRRKYGFDHHQGPIVLFSAAWLHDSRKGPHFAAQICRMIEDINPKLLLVGRYSNEAATIFNGLDVYHAGFIKDDTVRAELFAMADMSLMLSEEENAPLIVLECLASGTPVFGFDVGGIKEMAKLTKAGHLKKYGAADMVAHHIKLIFKQKEIRNMFKECEDAVASYSDIARLYLDQFK